MGLAGPQLDWRAEGGIRHGRLGIPGSPRGQLTSALYRWIEQWGLQVAVGMSDPVPDGHSTFPIRKQGLLRSLLEEASRDYGRPARDLLSLGSIEVNTVVQDLPPESMEVTEHRLNDNNFLKLWGSGVTGWLPTFSNTGIYFKERCFGQFSRRSLVSSHAF